MRSSLFWCHKHDGVFRHFFQMLMAAQIAAGGEAVARVRVDEAPNGTSDANAYWAWWDERRGVFSLVFRYRIELETAVEGIRANEALGRGQTMMVTVTEVEATA